MCFADPDCIYLKVFFFWKKFTDKKSLKEEWNIFHYYLFILHYYLFISGIAKSLTLVKQQYILYVALKYNIFWKNI